MLNKFAVLFVIVFFTVSIYIFLQSNNEVVTFEEKPVIKIQADNCNTESQECAVELNELNVKILFDDVIYYLKPFYVSVINENRANQKFESIHVDFKMNNMNMGVNRFLLKRDVNKSIWKGKALLPICITGRADWVSEVEILTEKNKYIISVPISVKK